MRAHPVVRAYVLMGPYVRGGRLRADPRSPCRDLPLHAGAAAATGVSAFGRTAADPPAGANQLPLVPVPGGLARRPPGPPQRGVIRYITAGIEHGFQVGFDYATPLQPMRRNMPSAADHPEVVDHYMTDKSTGRPVCVRDHPGPAYQQTGYDPQMAYSRQVVPHYGSVPPRRGQCK